MSVGKQNLITSRIKEVIKKSGLSITAFAQQAGIDPSNFAKKMKGSLPIKKKDISLISEAFNVSAQWILEGDKSIEPNMQQRLPKEKNASNIAARLMDFLNYRGIKPGTAEKQCGLSNGLIGKAAKIGSTLGSDKIEKILCVYPDLSAEWLLRGHGSMLVGENMEPEQIFRVLNMPPHSDKIIEVWMNFMECTKGMQELYRQSQVGNPPVQNP